MNPCVVLFKINPAINQIALVIACVSVAAIFCLTFTNQCHFNRSVLSHSENKSFAIASPKAMNQFSEENAFDG